MACILCRKESKKQQRLYNDNKLKDAVDVLRTHITKISDTFDVEKFLHPEALLCVLCLEKVESILKLRKELRKKEKELEAVLELWILVPEPKKSMQHTMLEQGISNASRSGKRTSSEAGFETSRASISPKKHTVPHSYDIRSRRSLHTVTCGAKEKCQDPDGPEKKTDLYKPMRFTCRDKPRHPPLCEYCAFDVDSCPIHAGNGLAPDHQQYINNDQIKV